MRILQLIDSLEVGGAERMAINYANALAARIEFSAIIATRKEGSLRSHIQENVPYLCLHKQYALDPIALFKLRTFCKENKVEWVHAHGTSYFMAFLLKLVYPKIQIIWHEHAGARSSEHAKSNKALWIAAKFFKGIIVVNHTLEQWCQSVLNFKEVLYLPNFTMRDTTENPTTYLKGIPSKRIVCLANLRHPKNHDLLLRVAKQLKDSHSDWTFHLIGKDAEDAYSNQLKEYIKKNALEKTVFIYGLREDINHIIEQATIGVLTSSSEGLPVALLEYGLHKKAVVATAVGEIPLMITTGFNGFTVASDDDILFYDALVSIIENENLRKDFGNKLHQIILDNHSENAVIAKYIHWINQLIKC